jgi:hypothetical protein
MRLLSDWAFELFRKNLCAIFYNSKSKVAEMKLTPSDWVDRILTRCSYTLIFQEPEQAEATSPLSWVSGGIAGEVIRYSTKNPPRVPALYKRTVSGR